MKSVKNRWVRFGSGCLAACLVVLCPSFAESSQNELPLMPEPAHLIQQQGQMLIDVHFDVKLQGYSEPRLMRARERFLTTLAKETGLPLWRNDRQLGTSLIVETGGASDPVQALGEDESYRLEINASGAHLKAPNPLGVMHGLQTFLQLVAITPQGFAAPAVTIEDQPRFPWRGLMIDSGRHFMPLAVIERNLDGMEAVKLNVFHWHLSEDQGFRVESKTYPLLQEKGSDGHFYTQEQVKGVIEYARDRGIRVIPEFDMPCHTTAWFAGYPDLASHPGTYKPQTDWGIFDPAMDPSRESTFQFLDRFIGEMTALFPDAYFHIGGDECDGKQWDSNPRIQAFMREHGFKDNAALQSYFSGRVQKLVAAHHKIMVGWDEVLQPDTPRDVVIQSWRGQASLAAAARKGNRGILSNGYYIDLNEPASRHYLADPLGGDGASLTPEEKTRVLGGEATMWSEFVTPENIDSRIWPRTAAIAERLWSAADVRDVGSMYRRLAIVSLHLQVYGLEHNNSMLAMLQRMSGSSNPEALQVLAEVVQPPEEYQREELGHYDAFSPLNHLVDAVSPESDIARHFNDLCKAVAAGNPTAEQVQQVRAWLTLWSLNDAKLQPTLASSNITTELVPLSRSLAEVAAIGLKAMDALAANRVPSAADSAHDLQVLEQSEKPQAVLRDMVAPSVEILVRASGHLPPPSPAPRS